MKRLQTSLILRMSNKRLLMYYRACSNRLRIWDCHLFHYGYPANKDEEIADFRKFESYVAVVKSILDGRGHVERKCHG